MSEEMTEIQNVIGDYVAGFNKGDKSLLLGALHTRLVSSGFYMGELQWDNAEEFATFCAESSPSSQDQVPDHIIEKITISGQTAVAVVRDKWGTREFRDSLTLLKDEGRWQIVFKAFDNLA
jgi:hypothetical protein